MNRRRWVITLSSTLSLVIACLFALTAVAAEVPRVTKEEVKGMLGNPDVIIIDVRTGGDWDSSKIKILGAVREDPGSAGSWMDKYPKDRALVFY